MQDEGCAARRSARKRRRATADTDLKDTSSNEQGEVSRKAGAVQGGRPAVGQRGGRAKGQGQGQAEGQGEKQTEGQGGGRAEGQNGGQAEGQDGGRGAWKRLSAADYDRPCEELARFLLGKRLVRQAAGGGQTGEAGPGDEPTGRCSGVIVETEAYLGGEDKASHSYAGKRTQRTEAMYMSPGTAYVYNIYGVHCCINISSRGDGAAVLIRSLQPVEGLPLMRAARRPAPPSTTLIPPADANPSDELSTAEPAGDKLKEHQLCNGPSKLTKALGITKANGDRVDLATSAELWVEGRASGGGAGGSGDPKRSADIPPSQVVVSSRVGIGKSAAEWVLKPLRFYARENKCVSVRDKAAELAQLSQPTGSSR